jgi:acyl-CoA dehydrogenase
MTLSVTDEQRLLRENAERFLEENAPVTQLRELRDSNDAQAFRSEVWRQIVQQGWPGIASAAEHGGSELGHVGLGILMESVGRTLCASPLQATVSMGIPWLAHGATSEAHRAVLRSAIAGETLLALAIQEQSYFSPQEIATFAEDVGDHVRLSGRKVNVLDVGVADQFIVLARLWQGSPESGLTAFLIDARTAGLTLRRVHSVDSRHVGQLDLHNVIVPYSSIIGERGVVAATLDKVEDIVAAHASAELLGISRRTFELTCEYLKSRVQFGVRIGSFQALQHRAAHLFAQLELGSSIVLAALTALDTDAKNSSRLASAAKAKLCQVSQTAVGEAIQMHGGIGVTDDLDIGLYLKRAKVLEQFFGGESYHINRFARRSGY